jgi:uncharacterized membrane protein
MSNQQSAIARLRSLDWARGAAVLLMIEAHTVDAWVRPADRASIAFRDLTILGGFAAPLFLWLAGVGVALSAARTAARTGSRAAAVHAICSRGLEIFVLAFLFRLQAFVISPGSHPITLFRVDILNVMGPAMVAAGLLWGSASSTTARALAYAIAGAAIAIATPLVRDSPLVDVLPLWIQWYVRPAGEHTTFTLLPWAGFVFAGAAVGTLLAANPERRMPVLHAFLAGGGVVLVAIGFYTAAQPMLFPHSAFWTSSPTFFAIRVGVLMLAAAALFAIDYLAGRHGIESELMGRRRSSSSVSRWLVALGRSSLFVYWIHVELVYGYATWLIHERLPLAAVGVGYAIFCVLMYRAVVLRDAFAAGWRARGQADQTLQTA